MILLGCSVIVELMQDEPHASVLAWFDSLETVTLGLSSVTVGELREGIAVLPDGRRKAGLEQAMNGILSVEFSGLVVPYGNAAAEAYGILAARHRQLDHTATQSDLMTAAIALVAGADLATRRRSAFDACGITVHDPWAHPQRT
ncbi:PIN domain-containing protein [Sulfitobacter sabulilitoris]|nr:PIN domain-containing protein [Sulfitobacter sabulilitoris]